MPHHLINKHPLDPSPSAVPQLRRQTLPDRKNPERISFQGLSLLSAIKFVATKRFYACLYFAGMLSNFPDASS